MPIGNRPMQKSWVLAKITKRHRVLQVQRYCKHVPIFSFSEGYDDTVDDLLYRLLALNPDKRITVEDAMKHAFFDSVRAEH